MQKPLTYKQKIVHQWHPNFQKDYEKQSNKLAY